MDNRDISIGLILLELQIEDQDSFRSRQLLHKKTYLLKTQGIDLGYQYVWYVYGPFSPTLSNYAYDKLSELLNYNYKDLKLNKEAKSIIKRINNLASYNSDLNIESWYQLLASITYIYENIYFWNKEENKNKEIIGEILLDEHPKYNKYHFEEGWNALLCEGMLN